MFRRMLIGAALLLAVAAAPAAAQYPFNVTPGAVVAGGAVTVSGAGCSAGAEVVITVTEAASTVRAVGDVIYTTTITADENGEFSVTFNIPAGTAVGRYLVTATCDGVEVANAYIDVVDATTPTTTPGGGSTGPIVRTGSDLNGLGLVGAGLITVGGIVLIATRSRRHQAEA